ncbi:MAG TPA: class IV adenylate cyclase [Blastocatellia bacterium]|nr:class IV adenylate cyclase [Blastocatellia bacterium]
MSSKSSARSHEIEVKLRLESVEPLTAAGIRLDLEMARHFEDNWLLDTHDRQLYARGAVLRVRSISSEQGVQGLLTLKEKAPADAPASQFKLRLETETTIGNPEQMLELLARLGYWKVFRYQKYRTVYRALLPDGSELQVMFDETPLGRFIELEGEETAIARVVERLGITPADYILQSYIALQAAHCRQQGHPLEDMIF